jgi:hypothetical protein
MAVKSAESQWPPLVGVQRNRTAIRRRFMEAERQRRNETWRAVQQTVRPRRESAWLASQSAHQKRATEILGSFDIEVRNVTASPLATFLLHYICCEALGKLLIASRDNTPPYMIFQRKALGGIEIDLRKLSPAVDRLGIPVSGAILNGIFLSTKDTAGQRSCRVLRNAVIHELRGDHVAEIKSRIFELIQPMADFIEAVRVRSGSGHIF